VLDSGTTFSYLPSAAYTAFLGLLRAALAGSSLKQVPGADATVSVGVRRAVLVVVVEQGAATLVWLRRRQTNTPPMLLLALALSTAPTVPGCVLDQRAARLGRPGHNLPWRQHNLCRCVRLEVWRCRFASKPLLRRCSTTTTTTTTATVSACPALHQAARS
jgi:hypothetical protein